MKTYRFQLISKNSDGQVVAHFGKPVIDYTELCSLEEHMGGFDPNGNKLFIELVELSC